MTNAKTCPKCGGPQVSLRSQNLKICVDCLHVVENKLKPDQKTLIKATR